NQSQSVLRWWGTRDPRDRPYRLCVEHRAATTPNPGADFNLPAKQTGIVAVHHFRARATTGDEGRAMGRSRSGFHFDADAGRVSSSMRRTSGYLIAATCVLWPALAEDWPEWRGKGRAGVWNETGILDTL